MINWDNFIFFAFSALFCWILASFFAIKSKEKSSIAILLHSLGIFIYTFFIIGFWIYIERPPLRTLGETRLWFVFFLSIISLLIYLFWHFKLIFSFTTVLSAVFILINIFKPEIHNKELMPALQSFWFIPHVVTYMFSYAFLGTSFLLTLYHLFRKKSTLLPYFDDLVRIGWASFSIAMFLGALWAKEAWGIFWDWDPKETWALLTWLLYLIYLLYRKTYPSSIKKSLLIIVLAFIFLQFCWYGVNYLPTPEKSLHAY